MRTVLFFAIVTTAILFTSCGSRKITTNDFDPGPDLGYDSGVVINGIRWATRNVAAPGAFAARPEDPGMLFQWGRQQGWAATGEVIGWNSLNPAGREWEPENNPCPKGWRIPTMDELRNLNRVAGEWTTVNGVNGRMFGTAPYQIFLPAVGLRHMWNNGQLAKEGVAGYYWSSTRAGVSTARVLWFNSTAVNVPSSHPRAVGFSVRCVAKSI